jgi:hypothetical protein
MSPTRTIAPREGGRPGQALRRARITGGGAGGRAGGPPPGGGVEGHSPLVGGSLARCP